MAALAFLLAAAYVSAQRLPRREAPVGRWYVVDRDDDVVVSALQRPDRDIPLLRGNGTIDASLYAVAAVLRDAERYDQWMAHVVTSRLLRRDGEFAFSFYQQLKTPWPVEDRDVVLQVRALFDPARGSITARFEDAFDPLVPPRDGFVRMRKLFGEYRLTASSAAHTQVRLVIDADPGGAIPQWLVASVTRELPREMIVALRRRVRAVGDAYAAVIARWKQRYGEPVPVAAERL